GGVRVREIERLTVVDARPADSGDAAVAHPDRAPCDEPEPGDTTVLLGLLERQLQAEADPEDRPARSETRRQRLVVAAGAQPPHGGPRRADSGQHREIGAGDVAR